ncbi:hypothetical protein CCM_02283 [Cordyceps militaris CM01]|uniref:SET domain-containing protein n=1 Tax=Cordyceps militaris (strain CM01) TaxID=983644 RepID=G3J8S7_CORMM|nr:uncharacterized protein CCM_02283 [Cordyceps militaris CM01]EGX94012.1 hypothetical protein CCM_02283 [Cordyceps militaris CM01]
MAETHQCSHACGTGSTTRLAQSIDMEKERRLRLQIAAPPPQSINPWSPGKKAMVHAQTQVDDSLLGYEEDARRDGQRYRALKQNFDILYIHETGTPRGLGVFAGRDLRKGRRIIDEPPTFSCIHWPGKRTAAEEWLKLRHGHRDKMRVWYRKLRNMAHGGNDTFQQKDKKTLEKFVDDYAFHDPQREKAHIYRLASYINHACKRCANAEFWVDGDTKKIQVKLIRDVKDGDEIFIFYNRHNLGFGCAVCESRRLLKAMIRACTNFLGAGRTNASGNNLKSEVASNKPATDNSSAYLGIMPMKACAASGLPQPLKLSGTTLGAQVLGHSS